jgi:hypothetical protein
VDLVEVDAIDAEAAKAVFYFEAEAGRCGVGKDAGPAGGEVPVQAAFGGNEESFAAAILADGLADDFF